MVCGVIDIYNIDTKYSLIFKHKIDIPLSSYISLIYQYYSNHYYHSLYGKFFGENKKVPLLNFRKVTLKTLILTTHFSCVILHMEGWLLQVHHSKLLVYHTGYLLVCVYSLYATSYHL